jgi:hypothetical protein
MKQTAVEWLAKEIQEQLNMFFPNATLYQPTIDKAKEMENSQNKYFHDVGFYTGRCTDNDKNGSFEYWINNYKND